MIGVIGRLKKDRGYDVILQAFKRVRDQMENVKLVIVGRSSQVEESIMKPLAALGLEQDVILAGYRVEDYFSVIAAFDIFLMMRAGSDGTARALREVLGMGKPAIVSTKGMLPELVIDGQTGYVVDLDEHALADRMVRLLTDDTMRARFGINARNYALSEWDYSTQAERLMHFLRDLITARKKTVSADSGKRKLSIAILLDKFLPSRGGERYFSFLAEELARRGHDVHVFASKVEADEGTPYQVHIVPVADFPRSARMISYMFFSARMVKRYGFDVIHGLGQSLAVNVLNPHGGVERAYLKQEFASISSRWYYGYRWLRRYLSLRHYLELWMQKRLYTGASVKQVIAISKMVKQDIISHFGFPDERIAVVFNTVDLDRFHPSIRDKYRSATRKELGLDDGTILLLFAGNNYRLKGLEPLLHAVAILKGKFPALSLRLVVLGRGQIWLYRRKAKRLGVAESVLFLGPVPGHGTLLRGERYLRSPHLLRFVFAHCSRSSGQRPACCDHTLQRRLRCDPLGRRRQDRTRPCKCSGDSRRHRVLFR